MSRSQTAAPYVGSAPRHGVKVVLLVQELLGSLVALVLKHVDAKCRPAASPAEAKELLRTWSPDLVVADLDLYEKAPEWMRVDGTVFPCLGLTRRRDALAKLAAFERGASDIIEVPFTPDEIVVRTVACVLRASGRKMEISPRLRVGRFEMDLMEQGIRLNDNVVRLTLLEQTLLYLFLAHAREVLGRDAILTDIWGSQSAVTSNVIDRHIRDLRVKLSERWREPRFIETVPGRGYRFIEVGEGEAAAQ